ncbi:hypothetical protein Clacol_001015 [Clathrus columnatus]|uniref:Uncharacterized protein n=1 Tax=Clathrus columnatus TaxID=1419009 RepID=A0AAV5A254_9AGAM|nr:hypothetical protein Clacol_001015 [Clathrus columnatus]
MAKMKKDLEREHEPLPYPHWNDYTKWWQKRKWWKKEWWEKHCSKKFQIIPWIRAIPLKIQGLLPKIEIMVVALIAPEFIVMWALRQYMAAKKITENFKGLSMTHAFFFIMGGFLLTDREGYPVRILVLGASRVLEFNFDDNVINSVKACLQSSTVKSTIITSAKTSVNKLISRRSTGETLTADEMADEMVVVANSVVGTVENIAANAEVIMPVALTAVLDAPYLWSELLLPGELPYCSNMLIPNGELGIERTAKVVALAYSFDHAAEASLEYLMDTVNTAMKTAFDEKLDAEEEVIFSIKDAILLSDGFHEKFKAKLQEKLFGRIRGRVCLMVREKLRSILKSLLSFREEDIQDKSKQDWLGKTFVLAQTIWFVTQCIARKIQRLPLTEIELIGCAYAALSTGIYFFWWNKPFRVDFPIAIPSSIPHEERELVISRPIIPSNVSEEEQTARLNPWNTTTVVKFLDGTVYNDTLFGRRVQVPTFYSGDIDDYEKDDLNFRAEIANATIFGGIHLFAWNYSFPTRIELWLWRISSLVIVVAPVVYMTVWMISYRSRKYLRRKYPARVKFQLMVIILFYVVARFVILFSAVASLRKLPSGALVSIDWLTFIAHVE